MDNQHKHIKGYRDLTEQEIAAMNELKSAAETVGQLLGAIEQMPDIDQRWLSIGRTDLQKGFMSAIRAVARPTSF